jgi:hypothetical protein
MEALLVTNNDKDNFQEDLFEELHNIKEELKYKVIDIKFSTTNTINDKNEQNVIYSALILYDMEE